MERAALVFHYTKLRLVRLTNIHTYLNAGSVLRIGHLRQVIVVYKQYCNSGGVAVQVFHGGLVSFL